VVGRQNATRALVRIAEQVTFATRYWCKRKLLVRMTASHRLLDSPLVLSVLPTAAT
jgi:hypothetical protein